MYKNVGEETQCTTNIALLETKTLLIVTENYIHVWHCILKDDQFKDIQLQEHMLHHAGLFRTK